MASLQGLVQRSLHCLQGALAGAGHQERTWHPLPVGFMPTSVTALAFSCLGGLLPGVQPSPALLSSANPRRPGLAFPEAVEV